MSDFVKRVPKRFRLLSPEEVLHRQRIRWAVRNVLPRQGVVAIYGASGTAKSFLCADLCGKLNAGESWFGYPILENLRAALFVLEGQGGLSLRLDAWQKFNGRDFPKRTHICEGPFAINDEDDVGLAAAVLNEAGGVDVIVVDTLNRAAPGADENRSADMGKIIAGATRLQALTNALVILVHHSGKDEGRGLRGHSSLYAALDVVIEVKRNDNDERWWRLEKSKDGEDGASHSFELVKVDLGITDEFDLPLTSVAISELDGAGPTLGKKATLGKNQATVLGQFRILAVSNEVIAEMYPESPAPDGVSHEALIAACKDWIDVDDSSRRTERIKDAIKSLIKAGHIEERDEALYLPA